MHEILADMERWQQEGKRTALATVVKVYGSAPRPLGAKMAVAEDGAMSGSVSGGCVEGAVVQEALAVLAQGAPRLLEFGISDEMAWDVGLACGGAIQVFVEPLDRTQAPMRAFLEAVQAQRLAALATVIQGPGLGKKLLVEPSGQTTGSLGHPELDRQVAERARELLRQQRSQRIQVTAGDGPSPAPVEVLVDVQAPPPRLVIVGGVHIAIPLVTFARALGFRTVVVDARSAFATPERFRHADELIIGWPGEILQEMGLDESTCVVTLTHDPKLDNPALEAALARPVRYVGALGSRRTHAARLEALRAAGVPEEALARIHAPVGLDLGGRRPEEIALAIMAEIVAVLNRGAGQESPAHAEPHGSQAG